MNGRSHDHDGVVVTQYRPLTCTSSTPSCIVICEDCWGMGSFGSVPRYATSLFNGNILHIAECIYVGSTDDGYLLERCGLYNDTMAW